MPDVDTADLYDKLWDAVAEIRDAYPRVYNDAPSDEVVEAVMDVLVEEGLINE